MTEWIFWSGLFGAVFSYFLYPLLLKCMPARTSRGTPADNSKWPRLSLIVTAHNEEARIQAKLENCLKLDYPHLEIIVASDASSDGTDEIVRSFGKANIVLARAEERKGKENAQLKAIQQQVQVKMKEMAAEMEVELMEQQKQMQQAVQEGKMIPERFRS